MHSFVHILIDVHFDTHSVSLSATVQRLGILNSIILIVLLSGLFKFGYL